MVILSIVAGVLCFEANPRAFLCGSIVTIRTPGTVAGYYSDFEVIAVDGDDRLALEVGSAVHADWIAGRWSPPCGRPVSLRAV